MLRWLADENLNAAIVRGMRLRNPAVDVLSVQELGIRGISDPELLTQAAILGRVSLTHDTNTMPAYAYDRMASGLLLIGVFIIGEKFPVGLAIDELLTIEHCTETEEWRGRIVFLPL